MCPSDTHGGRHDRAPICWLPADIRVPAIFFDEFMRGAIPAPATRDIVPSRKGWHHAVDTLG